MVVCLRKVFEKHGDVVSVNIVPRDVAKGGAYAFVQGRRELK
jgi:hypothetical protein